LDDPWRSVLVIARNVPGDNQHYAHHRGQHTLIELDAFERFAIALNPR